MEMLKMSMLLNDPSLMKLALLTAPDISENFANLMDSIYAKELAAELIKACNISYCGLPELEEDMHLSVEHLKETVRLADAMGESYEIKPALIKHTASQDAWGRKCRHELKKKKAAAKSRKRNRR